LVEFVSLTSTSFYQGAVFLKGKIALLLSKLEIKSLYKKAIGQPHDAGAFLAVMKRF
jgi:hypothetical protein